MNEDIHTLIESGTAHLQFASLQYGLGKIDAALHNLTEAHLRIQNLEELMIDEAEKKTDAILAKTQKRPDGDFDLFIRENANWHRLGIAKDVVGLQSLVTQCGYEAIVTTTPPIVNIKHVFTMKRAEEMSPESKPGVMMTNTEAKEALENVS